MPRAGRPIGAVHPRQSSPKQSRIVAVGDAVNSEVSSDEKPRKLRLKGDFQHVDPNGLQDVPLAGWSDPTAVLNLKANQAIKWSVDRSQELATSAGIALACARAPSVCSRVLLYGSIAQAGNHEEVAKAVVLWGAAEVGGRLIARLASALSRGGRQATTVLEGTAASHTVTFRANAGGVSRTADEALAITKQHGAPIDDDLVSFSVAKPGTLASNQYARYWSKNVRDDTIVEWKSFLNSKGKVAVQVDPRVLKSDDAIVGVYAHEAHEIQALEAEFAAEGGRMRADKLRGLIDERFGKLHSDAWDAADDLVRTRQAADASPPKK